MLTGIAIVIAVVTLTTILLPRNNEEPISHVRTKRPAQLSHFTGSVLRKY